MIRNLMSLRMAVQTVQKNSPATRSGLHSHFVRVPMLMGRLVQTQKLRKSNLHLVVLIWASLKINATTNCFIV